MASLSALIHGSKPEVAPFIPTDPIEMLKKLISGEITDYPQIEQLGNLFQQDMFDKFGAAGLDLRSLIEMGGKDAQTLLEQAAPLERGEIPEDVRNQVLRSAAFQSLGSGTIGGPMGMALGARNLGLTSLDLMRQGSDLATAGGNAAQRWSQIATGTILPPSSQLYSPQWYTQFMAEQNQAKQATKQLKYNVAAAPDPAWADRANLVASIIGMYLGGPAGGNVKATGSYGSMFGAGGQQPGATPGMGQYGTQQQGAQNPGFFSNIATARAGGQQTGFGGFLGSLMPKTTTYMGGVSTDVASPGYQSQGYGPQESYNVFNQEIPVTQTISDAADNQSIPPWMY